MRDVYVLTYKPHVYAEGPRIFCIADDFDRASMAMADYTPEMQDRIEVQPHTLLEDGD